MSLANTAPPHLHWPVGALQVSASGGHLGSEPCESDGFWVPFPSWVSQFKNQITREKHQLGIHPQFFSMFEWPLPWDKHTISG